MGSSGKIGMLVATVIVGLLFWSELIFSSVPSLFRLGETAEQLGWSGLGTAVYFIILALLNLVGGILAVQVLRKREEGDVRGLNVVLTLYGLFQLSIAFLLPPSLRSLYVIIGVVYGLFGLIFNRFGKYLYSE